MGKLNCFSELPISFTVQLVSPNENCPVVVAGAQDYAVRWDSLIGFNLDDMAHLQILAGNVSPARLLDQRINLIVGLAVSFFPVEVIVGLLQECKSEDEDEGGDVGEEKAYLKHVDELAERNN